MLGVALGSNVSKRLGFAPVCEVIRQDCWCKIMADETRSTRGLEVRVPLLSVTRVSGLWSLWRRNSAQGNGDAWRRFPCGSLPGFHDRCLGSFGVRAERVLRDASSWAVSDSWFSFLGKSHFLGRSPTQCFSLFQVWRFRQSAGPLGSGHKIQSSSGRN